MLHNNSDQFYILRGDGNNSTTWAQYNGRWPLQIDLNNNNATFGGNGDFLGTLKSTGDANINGLTVGRGGGNDIYSTVNGVGAL